MKIQYRPYVLHRVDSEQVRNGALLRVESGIGVGYADLHPWPELGDPTLGQALRELREGAPHAPILRRSLGWAHDDAVARAKAVSSFAGLRIPPSHRQLQLLQTTAADLEELWRQGFSLVKFKVGGNLAQDLAHLNSLASAWPKGLRLRLDVGARASALEFSEFWQELQLQSQIELVEDPVPFSEESWSALAAIGVPIATDRVGHDFDAKIRVYKPAVDSEPLSDRNADWIVTSYLDHPLGQMSAALAAARSFATSPRIRSSKDLLASAGAALWIADAKSVSAA